MKGVKLFLTALGFLFVTTSLVGCVGNIGAKELLLILLIVLILFGGRKLPELARSLGKGLREFKKAAKEFESPNDDESDNTKLTSTESSATQSKSESEKEQS